MLVLQKRWFSVLNLSGATNAWQDSYKVDHYLVRIWRLMVIWEESCKSPYKMMHILKAVFQESCKVLADKRPNLNRVVTFLIIKWEFYDFQFREKHVVKVVLKSFFSMTFN